jgi:hypothetical protein
MQRRCNAPIDNPEAFTASGEKAASPRACSSRRAIRQRTTSGFSPRQNIWK